MALVKKQHKTIQHPTEPETRFVIRVPLSAGDLSGMTAEGGQVRMSINIVASVIESWTYDECVCPGHVEDLDIPTFQWVQQEVMNASEVRTEEEKKDSSTGSEPTTVLAPASSPVSSAT